MRKILGAILIFPAILSGWGCAGRQDVREGDVRAGEGRRYELTVIDEFKNLTLARGVEVLPFESEIGEKMPTRLLEQITSDIERRIEKVGLSSKGIQRATVRGKIIGVSDGQEGKVVVARVEFFDPHTWLPLGTVEIRGHGTGRDSLVQASAAIALAVSELIKEKAGSSIPH